MGSSFQTLARRSLPRILLVEDDALIGIMLEDDLWEAGFEVLGPYTSCAATLKRLRRHVPDAAILDITLTDGPCVELARVLREQEIPFLVFTGQLRDSPFAEDFAGAPWIEKPSSVNYIVQTLWDLLPGDHPPRDGNQQ
jgi:DNA-binding response OmpR family regulator